MALNEIRQSILIGNLVRFVRRMPVIVTDNLCNAHALLNDQTKSKRPFFFIIFFFFARKKQTKRGQILYGLRSETHGVRDIVNDFDFDISDVN